MPPSMTQFTTPPYPAHLHIAPLAPQRPSRHLLALAATFCLLLASPLTTLSEDQPIIPTASAPSQPIALDAHNPHYFTYNGVTTVLITSGEHYGAVLNAEFDFHRYLQTLHDGGLNYTRIFGGSYVEVPTLSFGIKRNTLAPASEKFVAPWARSTVPGYAGGGNKFDLTQWNPAYFDRLHSFLEEALQ